MPHRNTSTSNGQVQDQEQIKLAKVIDIALKEIDHKTGRETLNHDIKWNVQTSKCGKINVVYRKIGAKTNLYTLRTSTDVNINVDDIHEFFDCRVTDDIKLDSLNKYHKLVNVYDNNRCLVHLSRDVQVPQWMVKPRDSFFIKKRFKFDNYTINAGENGESAKEIKMTGNLCYSVGSDHPDYVETLDNHVRCWVEFAGYVFIPKSQNVCTMNFVVSCDVRGKIPKKLANLGAPSQAINTAKLFLDNVETIQQMIKNRKENK